MSEEISISIVLLFLMFIVFIMLETCQEKYALKFGHQASYILCIGIGISAIVKFGMKEHGMMEKFKFDEKLFFYVCLPPIVFASGFNMHRGTFF